MHSGLVGPINPERGGGRGAYKLRELQLMTRFVGSAHHRMLKDGINKSSFRLKGAQLAAFEPPIGLRHLEFFHNLSIFLSSPLLQLR